MRSAVRRAWLALGCVALLGASASCGDVVRSGRSPMLMTLNSLQAAPGSRPGSFSGTLSSDVITNVTSPAPCSTDSPCPTVFADTGQVVLSLAAKDISVAPTTNNQVTVTRYRVTYRRSDGRNTPGQDVPYGFDGAVTGLIPPSGTTTLTFEIVRHVAKEESPLVQLISNPAIISTIADVTFYGTDQVGNDISVTGTMLIDFGNFGD